MEELNKHIVLDRLHSDEDLSNDEVRFLNRELKKEISDVLKKYKAELSFEVDEETEDLEIYTEIDVYENQSFVRGNFLYHENLKPDF